MRRARVPDALLALLAVAAVVAPIRALFEPDSWIPLAVVMALAVSVTGALVRALTRHDVPVVLWQIGVGLALTCWIFVRESLWFGLPRWETVLALNDLLYEARVTITEYAPPAPTGPGIILTLALLVWLTTLLVDFFAVTRRSPALAGIPLLAAFVISASNSGSGMPVGYFIVAAAAWLVLLGRSGTVSLSHWDDDSRRSPQTAPGRRSSVRRLAAAGRRVGLAAIVCAVLAAAVLPHLPTRFLLDGLGRATDSTGHTGTMTISSTVNLARSLQGQSMSPVLSYRSSASTGPLRVGVLPDYAEGVWSVSGQSVESSLLPGEPTPQDASPESFEVLMNGLAAPQLALPFPATSLTIDSPWRTVPDGTVVVDRRVDAYTAEFLPSQPDEEALQASTQLLTTPTADVSPGDLTVDPASSPLIERLLDDILQDGMTPIDKARAIQSHLRGPAYTYSLDLLEPTTPGGDTITTDPISAFLLTRQGFCTQFTAAMVMMARAEGIPARFAIGFLPGTPSDDGLNTVVGADAHAWPELFFDGVGWLRFEPTPSARSGFSPAYTRDSYGSVPTATPTARPSPVQPIDPFEVPQPPTTPVGEAPSGNTVTRFITEHAWIGLVVILGILGSAAMPVSAWWERRRRRQAARDEAARVEVIWQDLLERLDDVGLTPPPQASPRQAGQFLGTQTYLTADSKGALRRVVAAVESARYAPPVATLDPHRVEALEEDARTVAGQVIGALQRSDRVRSTWWPAAGVAAWHRRIGGVTRSVRRRIPEGLPWSRR